MAVDSIIARPTNSVRVMVAEASGCWASEVSATATARLIRRRIREETGLTASAGVSYNKFIAKLASDQNKPDGLTVIPPGRGAAFVQTLSIRRFHGIGPVTAAKMEGLGIFSGADLAAKDRAWLAAHFGNSAEWLYNLARGIDHRRVKSNRPLKSLGGERTFFNDLVNDTEIREALAHVCAVVWDRAAKKGARGRTVTLKLRYAGTLAPLELERDHRTVPQSRVKCCIRASMRVRADSVVWLVRWV